MANGRTMMAALALAAGAAGTGFGQNAVPAGQYTLVGTWAGDKAAGPGSTYYGEDRFTADGHFTTAARFPGGLTMKESGRYTVKRLSPTALQLSFEVTEYAPREICSPGVGRQAAPRCQPMQVAPAGTVTIRFSSPSSVVTPVGTEKRITAPRLLDQAVAPRAMIAGAVAINGVARSLAPGGKATMPAEGTRLLKPMD